MPVTPFEGDLGVAEKAEAPAFTRDSALLRGSECWIRASDPLINRAREPSRRLSAISKEPRPVRVGALLYHFETRSVATTLAFLDPIGDQIAPLSVACGNRSRAAINTQGKSSARRREREERFRVPFENAARSIPHECKV